MTNRFLKNALQFPLCCLIGVAGCEQRTTKELATAREKVVAEVMGKAPEKPTANIPVPTVPEKITDLEPSIVKQQASTELSNADEKSTDREKPSAVTPSTSSKTTPKPPPKPTVDDPEMPWTKGLSLPRETWEVQYVGNNPVGYFNRKMEKLEGGSIRHDAESRMRVSLKGEVLEQRIRLTTIEGNNGEISSLKGDLAIGENKQTFEGKVQNNFLTLTGKENGKPFDVSLKWESNFRGPFAVEQSMFRKPLKPGEMRKLKYFDPLMRKIVDGRLEASDYISTPTLLGGPQELLEVRNIGIIGDGASEALLWVDKKGEGFKSYIPANDIQSFRTEPITAQVFAATEDLRAWESVSIPLTGQLELLTEKLKTIDSISYEVARPSDDPRKMFKVDIGQRFKSVDPFTGIVTVFRRGREPAPDLDVNEPTLDKGTSIASSFVPSDNPKIVDTANKLVAKDKTIPAENATGLQKAKACQRFIHEYFSLKDFDNRIGTFYNMKKTKQANCLEHALFFASHCRALEIPTRIAMGVKFNRSIDMPAMNFHAWVEIREGDRWVPLDSSEDLSIAGSTDEATTSIDRIKISESNFNSPNPYLDVLSVLQKLPDIRIKVMPAEKTK